MTQEKHKADVDDHTRPGFVVCSEEVCEAKNILCLVKTLTEGRVSPDLIFPKSNRLYLERRLRQTYYYLDGCYHFQVVPSSTSGPQSSTSGPQFCLRYKLIKERYKYMPRSIFLKQIYKNFDILLTKFTINTRIHGEQFPQSLSKTQFTYLLTSKFSGEKFTF